MQLFHVSILCLGMQDTPFACGLTLAVVQVLLPVTWRKRMKGESRHTRHGMLRADQSQNSGPRSSFTAKSHFTPQHRFWKTVQASGNAPSISFYIVEPRLYLPESTATLFPSYR
ncbi:hypothetical protein LZ32DRAFT_450937 [Colletotrichum eremochloae]|nr:hypothetical protein LZ32DRAFT_450937 [Colletotrichum eremochloae]